MTASRAPEFLILKKQRPSGPPSRPLEVRNPGKPLGLLIVVITMMLSVVSNPGLQAQGFSNEDRAFADALIRELKYFDTARRWLAEKRSARTTKPEQQAEIDSRLIDILQAEGKGNEAIEALAEFKKKWPTHPRAALGSLERVGSEFAKVLGKLEESKKARDSDSAKADQLVSEATSDFKGEVQKPLDLLIQDLFKQAKAAKGNEKLSKTRLAYQAELARVNIFLVFARSLGEGEVRDSYLERGLKLADYFVNERDEFYIMRYEAQIQKGLYLFEMTRYAESAEELELIFDIEPFARPPYSPQLLKAFHTIRLKAYLFSAKAYNSAKKPGIAVSILKPIMRSTAVPGDPFAPAIGLVESDSDLQQFAVLARLEYGIAMADAGDAAGGMSVIHKVISKYEALHKETKVDKYRAFVIDARKALGRVSSSGSAALSGRDFYQAAIGLKSELKLEEALRAFQTALAKLSDSEVVEYAPICLNEIGELSFILKRYDEAAVAFSELAAQHSESEIFRKKAATSFAASVDKAKRELGKAAANHAGYADLTTSADQFSGGDTKYQVKMSEAGQLEGQGNYAQARSIFLSIPAEDKGIPVSYYLRAQARGFSTLVREYEIAGNDDTARKALLALFKENIEKLQAVLDEALKTKNLKAAGVAALGLGQMHYNLDEYPKAAEVLKLFANELVDDEYYRCRGLGYLILAMVETKQGKEAAPYFNLLKSKCPEDPSVANAAYSLSDAADAEGNSRKAAIYLLDYAKHPTAKDEIENIQVVMKIVQTLSDGGLISDARYYVKKAKQVASRGENKLDRELVYMEGKIAYSAQDWKTAVATFQRYVDVYKVDGVHYEDPFVCRDLAWSVLKLARQNHPKPAALPLPPLRRSEELYNHAFFLIHNLLNNRRTPGKKPDAELTRQYWRIALRLQHVRVYLARAGAGEDAYTDIHKFVNENQKRIRTESQLWGSFLKVWGEALDKLGKNKSDYIKAG